MRAWSCGLTSAVGTAISLAGTSRVPASRAKAAVGTATPSARTTKCNLKLILTGRLLLLERVSWMNPNLRRIVAIFRVVRNSDQLGPVAKNGMAGATKWPLGAKRTSTKHPILRVYGRAHLCRRCRQTTAVSVAWRALLAGATLPVKCDGKDRANGHAGR